MTNKGIFTKLEVDSTKVKQIVEALEMTSILERFRRNLEIRGIELSNEQLRLLWRGGSDD